MTKRKRTDTTAPELPLPSPPATPLLVEQGGGIEGNKGNKTRDLADKQHKEKRKRSKASPSGESGPPSG
jgi:hypothetical protein